MKTFPKSAFLVLLVVWAGSATVLAQTGTLAGTNQPAATTKMPMRRFSGKIVSVDSKAKSITIQDKTVFVLTDKTKIIKLKKSATFDVLAKDQAVTGIERQDGTGKWLVETMNVGDPRQVLDAPVPKTFIAPPPKTNAVH